MGQPFESSIRIEELERVCAPKIDVLERNEDIVEIAICYTELEIVNS